MLRSKLAEEEGGGTEEPGSPSDTHEPIQRRVSDALDKIPVRSKERKVDRNSVLCLEPVSAKRERPSIA